MNKEETIKIVKLSEIESKILDIIYDVDEFNTSDLQGAIQAQVLNAYNLGKQAKNKG
jgi:hypothetical protein